MKENRIVEQVREDLKVQVDARYKKSTQRFFKESVNYLGVSTPTVRQIGKKYWLQVKNLSKKEIFDLCEQLLESQYNEEKTIAFQWAFRPKRQYSPNDFSRFEKWLKKYVTNWGLCDDFCTHALGELVFRYPRLTKKSYQWTKSQSRWLRRASAVVLIYSIRKENIVQEVLRVAKALLKDQDDLVQKGYGWLLKETANHYRQPVFAFVVENKSQMPRTALRYAIEKMPSNLKKQAMA